MNARELLKEARAELAKVHDHLMELTTKLPMQYFGLVDGNIIQAEDCLIDQIDAYLAAPEEDAMEIARQAVDAMGREMLALGTEIDTSYGPMQPPEIQEDRAVPYLAALIEGMRRRVPRAMLEDVAEVEAGLMDYNGAYTKLTDNSINLIAAKHGVVIE